LTPPSDPLLSPTAAPGGFAFSIQPQEADQRLDALVAARIRDISRSLAARLIARGDIRVNGTIRKAGYRVKPGDAVSGRIPAAEAAGCTPEPVEFGILYEDQALIVVNKPPGLVVHPAAGHRSGTLVHGLLHHCPDLQGVGGERRPGIVHRLDKDTSGILLVAKNQAAHVHLSRQFKTRSIQKTYLAIVRGELPAATGGVSLPIGRHPVDRKKMSTRSRRARSAETHWRLRRSFQGASLLEVALKTGRTHQIRVHLAAIGHGILGDPLYGKGRLGGRFGPPGARGVPSPARQMLHAWRIGFHHPVGNTPLSFEAPLPQDMVETLRRLAASTAGG
jgi:23S rRNA pseudouridine1911/1915/1917 synthase